MVHAAVGNKAGHGAVFKRCALKVGLAGKMRSTTVGPELKPVLETLVATLGAYPHAKLNLGMGRKKQSTRMVKQCCEGCEYIVRSSQKCIDEHGPVICPSCNNPMEVA